MTHEAIGADVRRGTCAFLIAAVSVGSNISHRTVEFPAEAGNHSLPIREKRDSSGIDISDVADRRDIANRRTAKWSSPLRFRLFALLCRGPCFDVNRSDALPWVRPVRRVVQVDVPTAQQPNGQVGSQRAPMKGMDAE